MGIKALYIGAYLGVLIGFTVQWSHYATLPKEIMDFPSCILDKKFNRFIKGGYHVGLVTIIF